MADESDYVLIVTLTRLRMLADVLGHIVPPDTDDARIAHRWREEAWNMIQKYETRYEDSK